nr:hypothetical protein Itr_chr02CG13810 [Ipomoea trifida]
MVENMMTKTVPADGLNDNRAASAFDSVKAQYHQLAKWSFEDEDYDEYHLGESIQLCNGVLLGARENYELTMQKKAEYGRGKRFQRENYSKP